jgi:rRNA maturation protein Nop10
MTLPRAIQLLPLFTLLTISTSLSACKTPVRVISADQQETFVNAGDNFKVPVDGVFMPDARYNRYRRAVADKIMVEQSK